MSSLVVTALLALAMAGPAGQSPEEAPPSPRTLFEAGRYQDVIDVVAAHGEAAPPSEIYLAADSLGRLDRKAEARDMYARLDGGNEEDPWTFIGRSALAVADGDYETGLQFAQRAVDVGPESFDAHYHLGLVQTLRGDFSSAAPSLERASQLDPTDAYAHYYAGLAYNKIRRVDLMSRHFQAFVKLAPEAPERPQVQQILRTLRF